MHMENFKVQIPSFKVHPVFLAVFCCLELPVQTSLFAINLALDKPRKFLIL